MNRIYVPATSTEQWTPLLAEPEKHWRTGFSARTLAHSWQEADGFPTEVLAAFRSSPELAGVELLLAIPEHKTSLPGGGRASQSDIWVLGKVRDHLVSIAVEGKVEEPFGPTVEQWLEQPSDGKARRLAFLQEQLALAELPPQIRYQLLHRTVSALLEAKRFGASHAVMLVHSFSPQSQWFSDFGAFAALLGVTATLNTVSFAGRRSGVDLHVGWVCGDPSYLEK
jgi:hypothetical protein